jgi:hypothetical protein
VAAASEAVAALAAVLAPHPEGRVALAAAAMMAAATMAMSRKPERCDRGSTTVSRVLPTHYHSSHRLLRIACVRQSSNPWLPSMSR